jgi:hypothetical protein
MAALGSEELLVLAENEEGRQLLHVNVREGRVRPGGGPRVAGAEPFACKTLEAGERPEDAWLLLGFQGPWRAWVAVWHRGRVVARQGVPVLSARTGRLHSRHLVSFGRRSWAVWGNDLHAPGVGWDFAVQTLEDDGQIHDVANRFVDPLVERLLDLNGACAGPGERVAFFFVKRRGGGYLLTFGSDGRQAAEPVSLARVRSTRDGLMPRLTFDYQNASYQDARPVVWHDRHGILFNHDVGGYFLLRPGPEALPLPLPPELKAGIPGSDGRGKMTDHGIRLAGGGVLLTLDTGGLILGPDGVSLTRVGVPPSGCRAAEGTLPG